MNKIVACLRTFLTVFTIMFMATSVVHAKDHKSTGGVWVNELGSELYIGAVAPNGLWKGVYINKASGTGCQNSPFSVSGYTNGTAIGFTVNWSNAALNCQSITSWTGNYSGSTSIVTDWNLSVNNSTTILKGSDTFTYQAMKTQSLLKK